MITLAEMAKRMTASKGGQTIILLATARRAFCLENMKNARSAKMKRFRDLVQEDEEEVVMVRK